MDWEIPTGGDRIIGEKKRLELTYADYFTTPEDKRGELLNGELAATPAPNEAHQRTQAEFDYHLMTFVKARGLSASIVPPRMSSFRIPT